MTRYLNEQNVHFASTTGRQAREPKMTYLVSAVRVTLESPWENTVVQSVTVLKEEPQRS